MNKEEAEATLEITNWAGISIGATHFYAHIWIDNDKIELEAPLSAKEAKYLNKNDKYGARYKVGMMSSRIGTEKAARQAGLEYFLGHKKPHHKVLLVGDYATCDAQEILWMKDNKYMQKLNAMHGILEMMCGDSYDPYGEIQGYEELQKEWEDLYNKVIEDA